MEDLAGGAGVDADAAVDQLVARQRGYRFVLPVHKAVVLAPVGPKALPLRDRHGRGVLAHLRGKGALGVGRWGLQLVTYVLGAFH